MLDTGLEVLFPSWLPPDSRDIVFRGVARTPDGERSGLFAISSDGGVTRPLTEEGHPDEDYGVPMPSPDGTSVMYQQWDPIAEMATLRLLNLATRETKALPRTGSRHGEGAGMFSPDGSLIAFRSFEPSGFRLYVVPADGSTEPRALTGITPGDAWHEFSPDGTKVMLNVFDSGTTQLIDVETGEADLLPDEITDP